MRNLKLVLAALYLGAAATSLSATAAQATVIPFTATLDGAQEVPGPVVTAGTGTASMIFDDATNLFSWNISWSGLTGVATIVFFHNAPPGSNGPVVIGTLGPPTSPLIGSATLLSPDPSELLAGNFYINVHTDAFPAGEIRGQVVRVQVPEPGALAIFGLGLAGLGFMRRRRAA